MCYYNTHTPIAQLFFYFIHLGYRATSQSARYTASALDTCQKSFCWVSRVYTRPPFFYLCLYKCMLLFCFFLKRGLHLSDAERIYLLFCVRLFRCDFFFFVGTWSECSTQMCVCSIYGQERGNGLLFSFLFGFFASLYFCRIDR